MQAVETDFAVDSTGFGTSHYSRYYAAKYGKAERVTKGYLKAHAMIGVKTNVVTAVFVGDYSTADSPQLEPLLKKTAESFTIREVSADKAYTSHKNVALVVSKGAEPYFPMKVNARPDPARPSSTWNRLFHLFSFRKDEFAAHYHKRSNVEATFSAIKRVFGGSVRSRLWEAQVNEVLFKILCHNIRCLIHAMHELNVEPMFGPANGSGQPEPMIADDFLGTLFRMGPR